MTMPSRARSRQRRAPRWCGGSRRGIDARVVLLFCSMVLASCAARPTPCVSPQACAQGQTCTAGRCAALGAEVAPSDARRMLVAPSEIAVVSSRGESGSLPAEIPLGSSSAGSTVLLLRFPTPWGNRTRVALALLTLEPSPGALPEAEQVSVTVARVLEPWTPSGVSWGRLPRISAPEGRAFATARPPKTLRIDVTAIVQRWASERPTDQGLALVTTADVPVGATYASGASGARGPRLDVYLR
jgi:hypothetical protein